jgi:hypothetical protein
LGVAVSAVVVATEAASMTSETAVEVLVWKPALPA